MYKNITAEITKGNYFGACVCVLPQYRSTCKLLLNNCTIVAQFAEMYL